jgi:diguanylate cyclase (GGDEF)-like protein
MVSYDDLVLTAVELGWGPDRAAARLSVFDLLQACQADVEGLNSLNVPSLIEHAEAHGWSDVVRLAMFLGIYHERCVTGGDGRAWIEALLERSQRDGDGVMAALALAVRAQFAFGDRTSFDADRDLACATVLLENRVEPSSERVCAHIECAQAFERRDLWELEQRHHATALACMDPGEPIESHPAVLAFNRAETEVNWVAALRERGLSAEIAERATQARRALHAADTVAMPDAWREELRIFAELVDAICPPVGGAAPLRCDSTGIYAGYIHLARALRTADLAKARAHCDRATAAMHDEVTDRMSLFSCAIAAELEAAQAGHETAGLRWGREQIALRWRQRLGTLASMQSLIAVERRTGEHALLQQHAYVDALTGVANRRALARSIEMLGARDATTVAVAMLDLDDFKSINDVHGHVVGDAVLSEVAASLRSSVRDHDLVVRLGGDEFLLLLTTDDLVAARRRCEQIIQTVTTRQWSALSSGLGVSVSAGVAYGPLAAFQAVCGDADAALYRAKQAKGDQVALSEQFLTA